MIIKFKPLKKKEYYIPHHHIYAHTNLVPMLGKHGVMPCVYLSMVVYYCKQCIDIAAKLPCKRWVQILFLILPILIFTSGIRCQIKINWELYLGFYLAYGGTVLKSLLSHSEYRLAYYLFITFSWILSTGGIRFIDSCFVASYQNIV